MDDLLRSIKRFSVQDYGLFVASVADEFKTGPDGLIVIAKFVYPDVFQKLPNYIIRSANDIPKADEIFNGTIGRKVSEVWYCKNIAQGSNRTIFGRMLISNNPLFPRCSLHYDIVCNGSARIIEKFPNISVPFISVNRDNWNGRCEFENIMPGDMDENVLMQLGVESVYRTSAYTSDIIDFARYIFSIGCNHLCLEFRVSNNSFQFIDWDSDNDVSVINRSFHNCTVYRKESM